MSTDPKSEGVVIKQGTNDRVAHAAILVTPAEAADGALVEPVPYQTDEDGVFIIQEPDKAWKIEILHKAINTTYDDWIPGDKRKTFYVEEAQKNQIPGMVFFGSLVLALAILVFLYNYWHRNVNSAGGPLSNLMMQKIAETQHQYGDCQAGETAFVRQIGEAGKQNVFHVDTAAALVRSVMRGKLDSVNAYLKVKTTPTNTVIKAKLDTLIISGKNLESLEKKHRALVIDIDTSIANLLRKNNDLMQGDKDDIRALSTSVIKAIDKHDANRIIEQMSKLQAAVTTPPWPDFVPWRQEPWRYIEILLWALAGVLVHKIITTGVYLWKNTFQNRGIWMHIAHLFVVPLLVLVTMMLLSMVSFEFKGDTGGGVVIDIGDPSITRAFSFILAVAPWGVWDFVRSQSARIMSRKEAG